MSWFSRKAVSQRVVSVRPAAIEGLEGRCLLSGSPMSMGSGMHVDNSGPSVQVPQQNPSSGKNVSAAQEVKGVVTAVDVAGKTITVAGEHGGAPAVFSIPASATITIKDGTGGLAAIKVGAEIDVRLSPVDGSVVSVTAENPKAPDKQDQGIHVEGKVTAVDAANAKLTVTAEHSATATVFTIPAGAKITLNGKTAALGDIAVGSSVEIHFAADGTTILSVEAVSAIV